MNNRYPESYTFLFWTSILLSFAYTSSSSPFVTRQGSTLIFNNSVFRFGGTNVYWLGLDENVDGVHYPTKFRIEDALATTAGLGINVIRSHTLGVSTGNPLSFEPSLNVFNDSALDAADYAIYMGQKYGIFFVIPLTDNYEYYHGGYWNFCAWESVPKDEFYSNPITQQAFINYIQHRLNHYNPYTGRKTFEEPNILAWETGNELSGATPEWTELIATQIKLVDPNHLVLDGHYGIDKNSLPNPHVDCYSDHFYPVDNNRLVTGSTLTAQANKVYLANEYGWSSSPLNEIQSFLTLAQTTTEVSGTGFWSLFPHGDDYGFVQHNDGFTVHFPGDNSNMVDFIALVRQHAANMSNLPSPVPYPSPAVPEIYTYYSVNASLAWRGAAIGSTYTIATSTNYNGPYTVLCTACATDNQTPWSLPNNNHLPPNTYVKVQAINPNNVTGPWSQPWQVPNDDGAM